MKRNYIIFILLIITSDLFAGNVKEILARIKVSSLPFYCTKDAPYPRPAIGYPDDMNSNLPLETYQDLGLTQKNPAPADIVIFRKFKPKEGSFDLVSLDINVSEWDKKLLATYKDGELIDYIETEVYWYSNGAIYVKQWRIDENQNIIVTWLKVTTSTPISAFSDFASVNAQRIDTYYKTDTSGKFHEIKQVKYQPRTYTKAMLTDEKRNLWEGNETPIK